MQVQGLKGANTFFSRLTYSSPPPSALRPPGKPTEQPLYSGAIDPWVTSDGDEFPLPGEAASSVQRRRLSLKSFFLRGGAGETAWKFVGGVNLDATGEKGTGDDKAGVVEVDALTGAVLVRGETHILCVRVCVHVVFGVLGMWMRFLLFFLYFYLVSCI